MKVKYKKAGIGKMFAITEFGLEHSYVRDKFVQGFKLRYKYQKSVPETWVEKGYVTEVNVYYG